MFKCIDTPRLTIFLHCALASVHELEFWRCANTNTDNNDNLEIFS